MNLVKILTLNAYNKYCNYNVLETYVLIFELKLMLNIEFNF